MNTKFLSVTKDIEVNIEGRSQLVQLSIEFSPKVDRHYFVEALTETGFDLCASNHGYFKYSIAVVNTRLRSELSRVSDMLAVLEGYEAAIRRDAHEVILTEKIIQAKIESNTVYLWQAGLPFTPAANIHSLSNGLCVSWYEHDLFKQGSIEVVVRRSKDGQLQLFADDAALYDMEKLRNFRNSDAFKNSKLAFFNYNEVRRLLGETVIGDPERMSGLMPSERIE